MRYDKINEAMQRIIEFKKALEWGNKNVQCATKRIGSFFEKYTGPADKAYEALTKEEKIAINNYIK